MTTGEAVDRVRLLFEFPAVDPARKVAGRDEIARYIPHRGQMMLLDGILWHSEDYAQGVGVKHVRADEFWCEGHFPGRPLYPGVLQVESAAQLAAFLYYRRWPEAGLSVFCKIESAVFRSMVSPGDDLVILCRDVRVSRKRFLSEVMGIVRDKVTFEAQILGMSVG
jgi:3-hydroxymyristoyl/3-hydroxydecanoyl-(acyl carrier protein) dehydratase